MQKKSRHSSSHRRTKSEQAEKRGLLFSFFVVPFFPVDPTVRVVNPEQSDVADNKTQRISRGVCAY